MTTRLVIPAGIGDVAFMHVKLHALAEALGDEVVLFPAGEEPRRSEGFINLLPGVKFGGYSTATWRDVGNVQNPVISKISQLKNETSMLQANTWLETGNRIEGWLPELPTRYDFPFATTNAHRCRANQLYTKAQPGPVLMVYPAAYSAVRHWSFWEADGWAKLLRAVLKETGGSVVLVGADFDLDHCNELTDKLTADGVNVVRCVAEDFGVVIELMKLADALLAFPSGVPIVASLVGLPTVWWMPNHLMRLPGAWLNPKAVASGRIVTREFEHVDLATQAVLESAPIQMIRRRIVAGRRARKAAKS